MALVSGLTSAYTMATSVEIPVQPIRVSKKVNGNERDVRPYEEKEEQSYAMAEKKSQKGTDATGIILSEETKAFLSGLLEASGTKTANVVSPTIYSQGALASIPEKSPVSTTSTPASSSQKEAPTEVEGDLTEEEKRTVTELQARDAEVRAHEQAHLAAGQGITRGGAEYTYTTGPDNKQYAIGGSVQIETSTDSSNPDEALEKARQMRAAALAPASPSSQDMAVASQASAMEVKAMQEKAKEDEGSDETDKTDNKFNTEASLIDEVVSKDKEESESSLIAEISENESLNRTEAEKAVPQLSQQGFQTMMAAQGGVLVQNTGSLQSQGRSSSDDAALRNVTNQTSSFQGLVQTQTGAAVQALAQLAQTSQNPQNRNAGTQEKLNTANALYSKVQQDAGQSRQNLGLSRVV